MGAAGDTKPARRIGYETLPPFLQPALPKRVRRGHRTLAFPNTLTRSFGMPILWILSASVREIMPILSICRSVIAKKKRVAW